MYLKHIFLCILFYIWILLFKKLQMANGNLKDMSVLFNTETSQQGVIAYKVFLDTEPSVCVYL